MGLRGVIVLDPQIGRFPSAGPPGRNAPARNRATKSAELQGKLATGTLRNAPERSGTLRNAPERAGTLRVAPAGFGGPNRPNCKRGWRSERSGKLRPDLGPQIGRIASGIGDRVAPERFGTLWNAPAGFGAPNRL